MGPAVAMCSALLSALLVIAGTIKVVRPASASLAIRRTFDLQRLPDHHLPPLARGLGLVELAVGAAGTVCSGSAARVASAVTAALFVVFVAVTARARARGAACGCWGSLSSGAAGTAELSRRIVLAVLAIALAAYRRSPADDGHAALGPLTATALLLFCCALGLVLVADRQGTGLKWLRVAAAFGPDVREARVRMGGSPRRRLLRQLRHDPTVLAVTGALAMPELLWRRGHVSRSGEPPGQGRPAIVLVSVPGTAASVRIVAVDGTATTVIGQTGDRIVLGSNGVVLDDRIKRRAAPPTDYPVGA